MPRAILRDTGQFVDETGALVDPGAVGEIVLARSRCRFHLFRVSANLTRSQVERAARTYADAHAPFADTGRLLLRSPHGVEIWWWDNASLSSRKNMAPESACRAPGADGWRIIACEEGFDAQYWDAGGLVASTWRRTAFTQGQWAAFVLSVDGASVQAPAEPPAPTSDALTSGSALRARILRAPLGWRDAQIWSLSVALCAGALSAFLLGRQAHLFQLARGYEARAAAIEGAANPDERLDLYLRVIDAYQSAAGRGDELAAGFDALAAFDRFGLQPRAWRADSGGVSVTVDGALADLPLRDLVAALNESPALCGAEPNLSSEAGSVEIVAALETPEGCARGAP